MALTQKTGQAGVGLARLDVLRLRQNLSQCYGRAFCTQVQGQWGFAEIEVKISGHLAHRAFVNRRLGFTASIGHGDAGALLSPFKIKGIQGVSPGAERDLGPQAFELF